MASVTPAPSGERETVVLLHSLGTDRNLWRPQVAALEETHRVLTPDSRGHGGTAWRAPLDLVGWVDDLDAFLDATQGVDPSPVHLVGLSMGGVQAIEFAVRRPWRVASLVLADTFAALDPSTARARVDGMREAVYGLGMQGYADRYLRETLIGPVPTEDRTALQAAIAGTSPEAYLASAEVTFLTDHTAALAEIRQPTLVLVGEEDRKSPLPLAQTLATGIPEAQLVTVPCAGHLSNIENPAAFTDALRTFFGATAPVTVEVGR
jgi:3-oxoadipate enol-lactonase